MSAHFNENQTVNTTHRLKKCSVCRSTDHNISNCNDPATIGLFMMYAERFSTLIRNRLLDPNFHRRDGYSSFIKTIHKERTNILKFCLIQLTKDTRIRNSKYNIKKKLYASVMYHLFRNFKLNKGPFMHDLNNSRLKINSLLFDAEQLYWLSISCGNTTQTAFQLYARQIGNILEDHYPSIKRAQFPIKVNYIETIDVDTTIFECGICLDTHEECQQVLFDCSHSFCGNCVEKTLHLCVETKKTPTCPMCRNEYKYMNVSSDSLKTNLEKYVI